MKYLLVVAFAACAFAGALQRPESKLSPIDADSEIEVIYENEDGVQEIAPTFIISWQIRRAIRRLQKQMPCGFPQYGIPPLAPLKKSEVSVHYEHGILDTAEELTRFRVDGLDDFKINKFKLNIVLSKITFDFTFRNIRASAPQYATNTILDALNQLGVSVQYEGDGSLDFSLKNLRVSGTLKYKIPLLWGSIRITSLKTKIALEGCDSNITGILGESKLNELLNRRLENAVISGINDNQNQISESIENTVVPRVNALLKGNDFWDILDKILNSDGAESEDEPIKTSCVAPEDPWA
ncbi:uncharacterized protein LOC118753847 [Rhagoletis pomonella]|uniref:uncharacterized protein LOC118753687 n=1 Tax=Rhagoletis pomonella TaxID=28610 RepID=UPI001785EC43|nr:uncharacterized protein LOC118753687 [Rhagoletis pomonella]XP_036344614.1 uncharacterized protein LOC118753847 [Rhagoletis pomonella]